MHDLLDPDRTQIRRLRLVFRDSFSMGTIAVV
jgi:hypothetical protein